MTTEVEMDRSRQQKELQDAYREMEKYKDMVVKRSEDTARTIAYSIFKAKNDSITKEKLPHQMETYLRDEEGNFIHPNAVRYFLYQALELMKAEKVLVEKENDKKEKSFDGMYAIFDNTKTDDEIETVDQLTERKIDKKTQQEFKDQVTFLYLERQINTEQAVFWQKFWQKESIIFPVCVRRSRISIHLSRIVSKHWIAELQPCPRNMAIQQEELPDMYVRHRTASRDC